MVEEPAPQDVLGRALQADPAGAQELLAALHRPVRDADGLADLLDRAAAAVPRSLPAADCAGVVLDFDGDVLTAAGTEPAVVALNQAQLDEGDGPCLTAMRTGRTVSVGPAEAARRWPGFAARGLRDGLLSYASLPLTDDAGTHGSMSLHSRRPTPLAPAELDVARLLAAVLCRGVGDYRAITGAREQAAHLRTALESRPVIEQAKGILMAAHQVDEDAAFALLRTESRTSGVKLRDVAAQFVRTHTRSRDAG